MKAGEDGSRNLKFEIAGAVSNERIFSPWSGKEMKNARPHPAPLPQERERDHDFIGR
jgi:hypothetical protein